MLRPEQRKMRDAIACHNWDSEESGAPFYDGGEVSDNPPNMRPLMVSEGRRLSKFSDADSLTQDDAYSLRAVYLTFCNQTETNQEPHVTPDFPRVIGENAGVFVIQTGEAKARLFDPSSETIYPEGSLHPILARAPYESFDDEDGYVLALYKDIVQDEQDHTETQR